MSDQELFRRTVAATEDNLRARGWTKEEASSMAEHQTRLGHAPSDRGERQR